MKSKSPNRNKLNLTENQKCKHLSFSIKMCRNVRYQAFFQILCKILMEQMTSSKKVLHIEGSSEGKRGKRM